MNGLLYTQTKGMLLKAAILVTTVAVAFKMFYMLPRRARYEEFYSNYDINKEFEKMRAKGLFDSC